MSTPLTARAPKHTFVVASPHTQEGWQPPARCHPSTLAPSAGRNFSPHFGHSTRSKSTRLTRSGVIVIPHFGPPDRTGGQGNGAPSPQGQIQVPPQTVFLASSRSGAPQFKPALAEDLNRLCASWCDRLPSSYKTSVRYANSRNTDL
jgi:hypothetical protein